MRLAIKIILLAAAVLGGSAIYVDRRAASREAATMAAFPPEGQFLTVNGRQVHAVVKGSGPDLVLIHGAGGSTRDFTFDLVDRLTDRYRVIVFDRPGLGYTDRTDDKYDRAITSQAESPAEQADLLHAAALQLGATNPIVLGHSYGASVAMAWALEYPDTTAGIVDVAGVTMPWTSGLDALYTVNGSAFGGAILPVLISAFVSDAQLRTTFEGVFAPNPAPQGYTDYVGEGLSIRASSLRASAKQVNTLLPFITEMATRYATIDMPVEILHGDADRSVPIDIHSIPLSHLIPGANLTILPGVGHMPHHIDPDAVIAAIDRVATRAGLR